MKKQGFTIIELLVVIAIIGLLSSIVLVSLDLPGKKAQARLAKTLEFSQTIQSAIGDELVGAWTFENVAGGKTPDMSGNGNEGTIYGATQGDGVKLASGAGTGKALSFNGTSDNVQLSDSSVLSPGAGNFTVSAWFKTSKDYSANPNGGLIYHDYGSNLGNIVNIGITQSNKIGANFRDGDGDSVSITSESAVNNGIWHFVSSVRDSQTTSKLYLDGVLIGAASNGSMGTITTSDGNPPRIGEYSYYAAGTAPFSGQVDDVRIYNYARTADQIKQDYNAGASLHLGQ